LNIEIERKFTVNRLPTDIVNSIDIEQFYMLIDDNFVQRLRIFNNQKAIISLKQNCAGLKRYEFEYSIPISDAKKIIGIGNFLSVKKIRHQVLIDGLKWEVDQFLDKNQGLVIAEVELESETQNIDLPEWIEKDVTNQNKYYNYNLATKPYISW
tara:strand:- start:129 stop:590 length:462 start_codon:yes stop_codon:yes gene_type:complete